MHAQHTLWSIDHRRDFINIQIRGIAGQNRIWSNRIAKVFKHLFFNIHILKYGFDDQIFIRQVAVLGGA